MKCCNCKIRKERFFFRKDGKGSISKRDLWERFYKCRDLELNCLWQRSIFLGAFLMLGFTGYGCLIFSQIQKPESIISDETNFKMNIAGLILSVICIAISVIWVYMSKGSKRWYEVYEQVIGELEKDDELSIAKRYRMGEYPQNENLDDACHSLKAGRYSLSKLNTLIGQLSLIIWMLAATWHLYSLKDKLLNISWGWISILFICFTVIFFVSFAIKWIIAKLVKSSC